MSQEETSAAIEQCETSPAASGPTADALEQLDSTKQPRRVKVYEMKEDAWSDRGTGFCRGIVNEHGAAFHVTSEDAGDVILLQSRIIKDDLYQIQQNTLIVWQEPDGTDVALSFQEEEGCLEIWNFLRHVQKLLNGQEWDDSDDTRLGFRHPEDDISEDEIDTTALEPVALPEPSLGQLAEVEEKVHMAMASIARRESLAKFVLNQNYVPKLVAALEIAEDMESVADLHRLCNIIKALILLNDAAIFESILKDDVFLGVAGILEYDPDFPNHKAEHRKYLCDGSKFKEVVAVKDPEIRLKIHQTFRLQYLKDVVLARILDDPTFSILNSLIFFHQVDIIQHFQHNDEFLDSLFGLFDDAAPSDMTLRRDDAVLFIQQFTGIAKTLQAPARAALYKAFIDHGLFRVLVYALSAKTATNVRLAGADIIVAVIDHDPKLIRGFINDQKERSEVTISRTLIELLIGEKDLGIKAQISEAIRVLVDPAAGPPVMLAGDNGANPSKANESLGRNRRDDAEAEKFLELFYTRGDMKFLVSPILEIDLKRLYKPTFEQTALLTHTCDLLCFFIRAHTFRAKFFVLSHNVSNSIAQLLRTNERHLHLAALRYFRVCIGMKDEFYNRHLMKNNLFEPIVDLLISSSNRDNLLNSAILEFFESIRRENMKPIIYNLVENYLDKLSQLQLPTIQGLLRKYEQYEMVATSGAGAMENDENSKPRDKDQLLAEIDNRIGAVGSSATKTTILQPVLTKVSLISEHYDAETEQPTSQSPEAAESGRLTRSRTQQTTVSEDNNHGDLFTAASEKIGEKRRRSFEDSPESSRVRKAAIVEDKRNDNSGKLTTTVKKKMFSTFGKKEKLT